MQKSPKGSTVAERLERLSIQDGDCRVWIGHKSLGYGRININRKLMHAHRVAWAEVNGPIADGMMIDHKCRNRSCINPDHLQSVSPRENSENRPREGYGKTGIRGVSFDKRKGKYEAHATTGNRKHSAGLFCSAEDAAEAARLLRLKIHENNLVDRI